VWAPLPTLFASVEIYVRTLQRSGHFASVYQASQFVSIERDADDVPMLVMYSVRQR
jgi:hypothetical protein